MSRFGGIPVDDEPKRRNRFGGIAVEDEKEEKGMSALDQATAAATNFGSGVTLGLGDELGAIGSVLASKATGSEADWGDLYDNALDRLRKQEQRLSEENPALAFGSELAGGLVSPVNLIPGARGGKFLSRVGQSAMRGAAEGGVYGFNEGEGDMVDKLYASGIGALTGGGTAGALTGVTTTAGRMFNLAKELGRGDNFVPANMAEPDSGLGRLYRNYIGTAFGGRGAIRAQEARAIRNNPRLSRFLVNAPEGTSKTLKDVASENIDKNTNAAISEIADQQRDIVVKNTELPNRSQLKTEIGNETQSLKNAAEAESRKSAAVAQDGIDAINANLRREQAEAALPNLDGTPAELKARAQRLATEADMEEFSDDLLRYWNEEAFMGVKNAELIPDGKLLDALEEALGPDGYRPYQELFEDAFQKNQPISGELLMEIRNAPARAGANAGNFKYGEARQIVNAVDEQLERLLKKQGYDDALNELLSQKSAYGEFVDFVDAANRSLKGSKFSRLFDMGDLRTRSGNRKDALRGNKRSQGRAERARDKADALRAVDSKNQTAISNRQKRLDQRGRALKNRAYEQLDDSKKMLQAETNRLRQRKHRVRQQQQAAKHRLERETKGLVQEQITPFSQLASTAAVGAATPLAPVGIVSTIPAGIASATLLASERAQRALAGQTALQKQIKKLIENGQLAQAEALLARVVAEESAGG